MALHLRGVINNEAEYVGFLLCLAYIACQVSGCDLPRGLFEI